MKLFLTGAAIQIATIIHDALALADYYQWNEFNLSTLAIPAGFMMIYSVMRGYWSNPNWSNQ